MEATDVISEDTCSPEKISSYFSTKYMAVTSSKVAEEDAYCIHLSHDTNWENISVSLSDNSVVILKRDTLQKIISFEPHQKPITGLRFSHNDGNLVWTSSLDGTVKIWDIRSDKCERKFETNSDEESNDTDCRAKPLTAFDVSLDERILCAGTELVESAAFLLFWDIRCEKTLGGYNDSHNDDITQVKFNPTQADTLATASTDGLINVFDISQNDEDDAVTYCMNADVTVDKLKWLRVNGKYERLSAITDIQTLQYWDIKEAAPLHEFSREDIANSMKRKPLDECYLVSVNMLLDGDDPIVLVGSGMDAGSCLRTLKLNLAKGQLQPEGALLSKQDQLMSRAALYESKVDSYVTAGECGIVRVWKPEDNSMVTKDSVKHKKRRKKPY